MGTTLTQRREERGEGERNHPEPGVTYQTGRITYFSPGLIKISPPTLRGRGANGKLKLRRNLVYETTDQQMLPVDKLG